MEKNNESSKLNTEQPFFPYSPYASQNIFMNSLFNLLKNNKKVGIFESPTGTGKSLCLLSGIFQFLEYKKTERQKFNKEISLDKNISSNNKNCFLIKEDEEDWLSCFGQKNNDNNNQFKKEKSKMKFSQKFFLNKNIKIENAKNLSSTINNRTKLYKDDNQIESIIDIDEQKLSNNKIHYKKDLDMNNLFNDKADNDKIQVYYITRTHSQISQVVSEIKKIYQTFIEKKSNEKFTYKIAVLGSRKNLCINKQINQKSFSLDKINEMCVELITGKISFLLIFIFNT